jgi:hypothetical protein
VTEIEHLDGAALPALLAAIASRMAALQLAPADLSTPPPEDVLIGVEEAAHRLRKSKSWLYHEWRNLPFAVKVIGKAPRLSRNGLESFIQKRQRKPV